MHSATRRASVVTREVAKLVKKAEQEVITEHRRNSLLLFVQLTTVSGASYYTAIHN